MSVSSPFGPAQVYPSLITLMKSLAVIVPLLGWLAQSCLAKSSELKRATYPEPIPLAGNTSVIRDPTLCQDPTTKEYYIFSTGANIEIRKSTDLVTWEWVGVVWPDGAPWGDAYNGASNIFWAPDCTISNGVWKVCT